MTWRPSCAARNPQRIRGSRGLRARNSWATCRLNLKIWDRCFAKASILRKPGPPVNSFPPTCPVPEAHSMNLWQVGYLLRFEVGGGRCCIRSKSIREIAHNLKGSAQHRSQSFGVPVRHRLLSAAGSAASELGDWKGELAAGAEHWQCCTRTADTDPGFEGLQALGHDSGYDVLLSLRRDLEPTTSGADDGGVCTLVIHIGRGVPNSTGATESC